MSNDLKSGQVYDAKPSSWNAGVNDNGKPFVSVRFDNGLWWKGWLVGNATQHTVNALYAMGFVGSNPNELNTDPNSLDKGITVAVAVNYIKNADGSYYINKKNEKQLEVSMIFPKTEKKPVDESTQLKLKGIDLRAYLSDAKKEIPAPQRSSQDNSTASGGGDDDWNSKKKNEDHSFASDDIPF